MPILVLCTEENGLEIRTDNGILFVFESIRTNPLIPLTSMTKDECKELLNNNTIDDARTQAIGIIDSIVTEEGLAVGTPSVEVAKPVTSSDGTSGGGEPISVEGEASSTSSIQVAELITSPDGASGGGVPIEGRWADEPGGPVDDNTNRHRHGTFNFFKKIFRAAGAAAVRAESSRGIDATAGVKGLTGFVTVRFNPGQDPTMTLSAYTNEPTVDYDQEIANKIANTLSELATFFDESKVQNANKTIKAGYPDLVDLKFDNEKFKYLINEANLYVPHANVSITHVEGSSPENTNENMVKNAENDISTCITFITALELQPGRDTLLTLTDASIRQLPPERMAGRGPLITDTAVERLLRLCVELELSPELNRRLLDSLRGLDVVTSSFTLLECDKSWLTTCLNAVESRVNDRGASPSPG